MYIVSFKNKLLLLSLCSMLSLVFVFAELKGDDELSPIDTIYRTKETQPISLILQSDRKKYISLLFAGDTNFNWGVEDLQKEKGYLFPIQEIQDIFTQVDFRVLNLETVLARQGYPLKNKLYIFNSKTTNISLLQYLQIDLVILGNNHSMDMGSQGLADMSLLLGQANINYVGAGANRSLAQEPYYFEKKSLRKNRNHRFAIASLTHVGHQKIFGNNKKSGVASKLKRETLLKMVKKRNAIINVHWGNEYFIEPNKQQIYQARKWIKQGISAVIGHHPHIPQAIEIYNGGVIIYSLGNFLFGSRNSRQRENIIIILDYNKSNAKLSRLRIIPITGRYKKHGHQVRRLNFDEARVFWKRFYIMTKQHSSYTANKISVSNGIGFIEL